MGFFEQSQGVRLMLSMTVMQGGLGVSCTRYQWLDWFMGMRRGGLLGVSKVVMPCLLRNRFTLLSSLGRVVVAKQVFISLPLQPLLGRICLSSISRYMLMASSLSHSPCSIPPIARQVSFSTPSRLVLRMVRVWYLRLSAQYCWISPQSSRLILGSSAFWAVYLSPRYSSTSALQFLTSVVFLLF